MGEDEGQAMPVMAQGQHVLWRQPVAEQLPATAWQLGWQVGLQQPAEETQFAQLGRPLPAFGMPQQRMTLTRAARLAAFLQREQLLAR